MADEIAKPKVPAGIAMMLKTFGINADDMLKTVADFAQIMQSIDQRLGQIAVQNAEILKRLDVLEKQKG